MVKLFSDGADMNGIIEASKNPRIKGFTTNPTLMRAAGIQNYESFAKEVIEYLAKERPDTSLSLEVFADNYDEIFNQAKKISSWGNEYNYPVYVKIPVTYTNGVATSNLIYKLAKEEIKINVTAVFTVKQTINVMSSLNKHVPAIISIFAGRIADAGHDPERIVRIACETKASMAIDSPWEILWASSREAYNYYHAAKSGCHIITMTPDLIKKVEKFGKDLEEFSLETVKMFYDDAKASGYTL